MEKSYYNSNAEQAYSDLRYKYWYEVCDVVVGLTVVDVVDVMSV